MPVETEPVYLLDYQCINVAVGYRLDELDESIYYFVNGLPIFNHHKNDLASFRMITSQLIVNSVCTNAEMMRAFGVTKSSVSRGVQKFKSSGVASFYAKANRRKGPVMTEDVLKSSQELLNDGLSRLEVSQELGIKKDTLSKAILAGKLFEPVKKK